MSTEKTPKKGFVKYNNEDASVKQSFFLNVIIKITIVLTIVACIAMTVYLQSSIAEKEKKYNQIQEQIEDLEIKNEELNLTLNSDDIEAYMQKLAIEKYGYAYPDEIRFYDKSHN
jgi:cell division protein FtsB